MEKAVGLHHCAWPKWRRRSGRRSLLAAVAALAVLAAAAVLAGAAAVVAGALAVDWKAKNVTK